METITIPPFQPEDIESMKRRWPAALTPVYEIAKCERGEQQPPGLSHDHCFDSHDGIRMIVSVENHDGTHALHVSFSIDPAFQGVWAALRGQRVFANHCENRLFDFQAAGLIKPQLMDTAVTDKAIHYWFRA